MQVMAGQSCRGEVSGPGLFIYDGHLHQRLSTYPKLAREPLLVLT